MIDRIHIMGASGAGTTSLARLLCAKLGYGHLDTDDYYWEPTDPPYMQSRPPELRRQLLAAEMDKREKWILSGSLFGWGDVFIPRFQLVVFLYTAHDLRMERLEKREWARNGERILPGGDLHESSRAFIQWAAGYDTTEKGRSLKNHEAWLQTVPCPVIRVCNDGTLEESAKQVLEAIGGKGGG